jgi:hypothetical protein
MFNTNKIVFFQIKLLIRNKLFLIFIIAVIGANFILSDSAIRISKFYTIPIDDVSYWHGVYECLNSNYIVLFIFAVFYLLFTFNIINDFENKFFMLRIKSLKGWVANKVILLALFPIIYTSVYYFMMLIGNIFYFGLPDSSDWGSYKVSIFSPIKGIILTYFIKIFLLFILSLIFTALYILTRNIYKAFIISLGYYSFCYVFNAFIPIKVAKPFTILGGISATYFESPSPYLSLLYILGGGIVFIIASSSIIYENINKFEIR